MDGDGWTSFDEAADREKFQIDFGLQRLHCDIDALDARISALENFMCEVLASSIDMQEIYRGRRYEDMSPEILAGETKNYRAN